MHKILLVEDDLVLGESIEDLLTSEGFDTIWAKDGNEALELSYKKEFDLYLFDVDIPFINGFDLLKSLRKADDSTPCIFITANIDINSLSVGFESGCDDYIKKPFDSDELIIRINTQIKKSFNSHSFDIVYLDIVYDSQRKKIFKSDIEIFLTPMALLLFEIFMKNINKAMKRENILYQLYNGYEGSEPVLRVQISKLKKIGLNIKNIRGVGYILEKN